MRPTHSARAEDRVPGVGARRAPAEAARADHEVGPALEDRRDHVHELRRVVAVVPVEEDEDVRVSGRGDPGEAGLAVAAPRLAHDRAPAARATSAVRSREPLSTTITSWTTRRDLAHDDADRLLLVEGGDDDDDARRGHEGPV